MVLVSPNHCRCFDSGAVIRHSGICTMSEMIERVARVLEPQAWAALIGDTLAYSNRRTSSLRKARAAVAIVIEDCALVAEDEFLLDAHGEPDHSAHNWAVERIAARIRAAPDDSATQAKLEKLCSV
jgi:hypothetical protein